MLLSSPMRSFVENVVHLKIQPRQILLLEILQVQHVCIVEETYFQMQSFVVVVVVAKTNRPAKTYVHVVAHYKKNVSFVAVVVPKTPFINQTRQRKILSQSQPSTSYQKTTPDRDGKHPPVS